jgi:hypothetical protein
MRTFQMDSARLAALRQAQRHTGDRHIRHRLSRRAFLGGTAGAAAATVGAGLFRPMGALAAQPFNAAPKPTTSVMHINGVDFHVTSFGPGVDPSSSAGADPSPAVVQ